MTEVIPTRTGVSPAARPTEWITAVAGLTGAVLLYTADREVAALVSAVGSFLPAIVTAGVSWYESRNPEVAAVVPAKVEGEPEPSDHVERYEDKVEGP